MSRIIDRHAWFQEHVGETEKSFRFKLHASPDVPYCPLEQICMVKNKITGKEYQAGHYKVVFPRNTPPKTHLDGKPRPLLIVLDDRGTPSRKRFNNISFLQANPMFRGDMFQVASNFNGYESINETVKAMDDNFVTNYINDGTQGPIASISAAAGAISRVYGYGLDRWYNSSNFIPQIDFTTHVRNMYPTRNGYVTWPAQRQEFLNRADLQQNLPLIGFGLHKSVQASILYAGKPNEFVMFDDPQQIVHQMFTAAVNLGQDKSGDQNKSLTQHPQYNDLAAYALTCAYDNAYIAASMAQAKRLHLTMIGGGVFANDTTSIVHSMFEAHDKWGSQQTLEYTRLSLFNRNPEELQVIHDISQTYPHIPVYMMEIKEVDQTLTVNVDEFTRWYAGNARHQDTFGVDELDKIWALEQDTLYGYLPRNTNPRYVNRAPAVNRVLRVPQGLPAANNEDEVKVAAPMNLTAGIQQHYIAAPKDNNSLQRLWDILQDARIFVNVDYEISQLSFSAPYLVPMGASANEIFLPQFYRGKFYPMVFTHQCSSGPQ